MIATDGQRNVPVPGMERDISRARRCLKGSTDLDRGAPAPHQLRASEKGGAPRMLHGRMLVYLDVVARLGSIRKAGERLNVASSAINRQIIELERQLGTKLFQRLPRKLVLTAAGELMIAHVRQTLKDMDRTRALIEEMKGLHRGEIVLAVMSGPAANIMPQVLADFQVSHANVRVALRVHGRTELLAAVRDGEADLGVGFDLPREAGSTVLVARTAHLGAVMRADHALARRESLSIADCLAYPLVVADPTTSIRPHLDALCARSGASLVARVESNSVEVLRRLARAGDSITFLTPFDIIEERERGELALVPLRHAGTWPQTLSVIARLNHVNPLVSLMAEKIGAVIERTL